MTPELACQLARYNAWMNDKLYAHAEALGEEGRRLERGAFFGSIHATLAHLVKADRAWLNRFTDAGHDLAPPDDFPALRAARQALDTDMLAFAAALTPDWLAEAMDWTSVFTGISRRQPRWLLVAHMFNHQTHHRGQVTALLMQAGIDPGVNDLQALPADAFAER